MLLLTIDDYDYELIEWIDHTHSGFETLFSENLFVEKNKALSVKFIYHKKKNAKSYNFNARVNELRWYTFITHIKVNNHTTANSTVRQPTISRAILRHCSTLRWKYHFSLRGTVGFLFILQIQCIAGVQRGYSEQKCLPTKVPTELRRGGLLNELRLLNAGAWWIGRQPGETKWQSLFEGALFLCCFQ